MSKAYDFVKSNIGTIGAGVGGLALGGALGYAAGSAKNRKTRRKKSSSSKNRRKRGFARRGRYRRTPHTAGKGKDTSHKRIRYTKNGQPYIIMASGKARFISKKGARRSHKQPGGRY